MSLVAKFTFNPFQENTYVLYDETKKCIIIDPGCFTQNEKDQLVRFIEEKELQPVRLINTHCHLDHIFGNRFVAEKYDLELEIHRGEISVLEAAPKVSQQYGIPFPEPSPDATKFLEEGDTIQFGDTELEVLFTPGHSPASVSFFCKKDKYLIAGDVLFRESIGRTDLPGGDFPTLISSIKNNFFPLDDDVKVYSGHMRATTIGHEKKFNPFLK